VFRPDAATPGALASLADRRQVDEAVDYAARVCRATVSEFLASPELAADAAHRPAVELALEFFVPPASHETFAREFDRAMARRSMDYAAARRAGLVAAARLTVIAAGTFHQWRSAWRVTPRRQHDGRWSADRRLLDGLLHQARTGWHEAPPLA
jgi:hypothetical protein